MLKSRVLGALLLAVTLSSCDKNAVQDITGPVPGARIRFFNFGVNGPGVNFYADATKMTAITSATGAESTTGVIYGGVGSAGFYSAIEPGPRTLTGKIAATVDKDVTISTVTTTLSDGKAYSYVISGFYNTTTKIVEAFVVEDPFISNIDYTVAYVRFVHAISNAAPLTLYARNTTTLAEVPVGAAVAYKAAGAFTSLPAGVYDLGARLTGVTTNAVGRTAVSLVAGKVYTIGARGDITVVSTTAINRPFLNNTANR